MNKQVIHDLLKYHSRMVLISYKRTDGTVREHLGWVLKDIPTACSIYLAQTKLPDNRFTDDIKLDKNRIIDFKFLEISKKGESK